MTAVISFLETNDGTLNQVIALCGVKFYIHERKKMKKNISTKNLPLSKVGQIIACCTLALYCHSLNASDSIKLKAEIKHFCSNLKICITKQIESEMGAQESMIIPMMKTMIEKTVNQSCNALSMQYGLAPEGANLENDALMCINSLNKLGCQFYEDEFEYDDDITLACKNYRKKIEKMTG